MVGPFKAQGLALAYSIAGLVSMVLLYAFLHQKVGDLGSREIASSLLKIIIASVVMGAGVLLFLNFSDHFIDITSKSQQLLELFLAVCIGLVIYIVMAVVLRIEEMQAAVNMLRRKIRRG